MYLSTDINSKEIEQQIGQLRATYKDLILQAKIVEGGIEALQDEFIYKYLQENGIFRGNEVLVDFKDSPNTKRKFVRAWHGRVVLRGWTPKGNLSSVTEEYPLSIVYNMRPIERSK